ncbi:hypothetical protein PIB30_114947, partial [Stylosanthes scabra]|nr:hypothetical protein [Stylosanthes scabra]
MDVDYVNKEDLLIVIRELGYVEISQLYWHDPTQINFEDGLHELVTDMDINNMCDCCLNNNLKEFHIYIEHNVNIPVPAEENANIPEPVDVNVNIPEAAGVNVVISSSSSSSSSSSDDGGYESAEDEPYKPPPP